MLLFVGTERVRGNPHMLWAFVGVGAALLLWFVALVALRVPRAVQPRAPVKQHYIQAMVQLVLYAWWGWHWIEGGVRPMFDEAPLIVAQLCYLYAFDGLWSWTRGRAWFLASGPAPIVLSTNLFIWFRDDWFVWQFAMITVGLLGKEYVRWQKEGRRTHVFNPSSFGLAVAATLLIVTGTTDLTWAKPLATTIQVPHIFVVLFLLGLVVQGFFAVTLMTFAAALAMVASNLVYTWSTGVYLFGSVNLPAAAFLGLHLLMTDPSTSPRSNVGRTLFGLGYGFGYVVMFELLGRLGAPELYAKLYPVPILNCCLQLLDRLAHRGLLGRLERAWQHVAAPRTANLVHMGLWSVVFSALLFTGYLDGPHPGDSIAFWRRAVAEGRFDASRKLVMVAGSQAVGSDSAAAYNELGVASLTLQVDDATPLARAKSAAKWFAEAARRGSDEGALNLVQAFLFLGVHRSDAELAAAQARLQQLAFEKGDARAAYLLGLCAETGGGVPVDARVALQFYRRCPTDDLFAQKGIVRLALQRGALIDVGDAPALLGRAAESRGPCEEPGDGEACCYLAHLLARGLGVPNDLDQANRLLASAADLGFHAAGDLQSFVTPPRKSMRHPPWRSAFATD
ncbi:MAG: SEL1-like repeat protein [Planctomycetes bacterium]|nr:SEL1-like repeat protein [Planctomycetota bacterium]